MQFKPIFIEATTLDDAWHQLLWSIAHCGRPYRITAGSREGQLRLALDYAAGFIHNPHQRPLAPRMPEGLSLAPPTTDEAIEQYFANYLMDINLASNEHYRYATWIVGGNLLCEIAQLDWVLRHLKRSKGNEHCYITVGTPEWLLEYDRPYKECPYCQRQFNWAHSICPHCQKELIIHEDRRKTTPCLRGLDFRIIDDALLTHVVYRCIGKDTHIVARVAGTVVFTTVHKLYQKYMEGHTIEVVGRTTNGFDWVQVGSFTKKYQSNICEIQLRRGGSIYLTRDHKVKVFRGTEQMIPVRNLMPGDIMLSPRNISHLIEDNASWKIDILKLLLNADKEIVIQSTSNIEMVKNEVVSVTNVVLGEGIVYDIGVWSDHHTLCVGPTLVEVGNSWDLIGGFPTNLGGFTLLNEYVAQEVGCEPGPLAFSCKSLHIYEDCFDYLKARLRKDKIPALERSTL